MTARDDAARTFTAARRRRAWSYHVTDKTRFVVDGVQGSWWDVRVGTVVQVRWHRTGSQRVADIVGIRARRNLGGLNVRFWHKADISRLSSNVRFWG